MRTATRKTAEPNIAHPFVINLNAKANGCEYIGTIESSYSELLTVFGPGRRAFDDSNEWAFTGPAGETYIVYDSLPSEQFKGNYIYSIGALTQQSGQFFALWLSETIGAFRVTKDSLFMA